MCKTEDAPDKVREADYMREVDHSDLSRDKERRVQHRKPMTVFRDENNTRVRR